MNAKHHFLLGMLVGWLYMKGCKIWPLLCGPLSRGFDTGPRTVCDILQRTAL